MLRSLDALEKILIELERVLMKNNTVSGKWPRDKNFAE